MTWWEWLGLGLAIWALLIWAICVANYRFWNFVQPLVCTGCAKGRMMPGCPVHDPGRRLYGEDPQATKGKA